jgi:6-phosphofructokinase 1
VRDVGLDIASMRGFEDVALVEAMGRHTGWLAAATALARDGAGGAPHVILVPERPFAEDRFLAAVRDAHRENGVCVVAAAEGVRDAAGTFLTEKEPSAPVEVDASGQKLFTRAGGPLPYLARLVRERAGLRCRIVRPDLIQRSSTALASEVDRRLAEQAGRAAVGAAAVGETEVLVALERTGREWKTRTVPLAGLPRERLLPEAFLDADALDVTPAFLDYARAAVGPLATD